MDTQQLNTDTHAQLELEQLRAALMVRETLYHARYDAEKSEIASLRRRLDARDAELRALRARLNENSRYLYASFGLLGLMLIAAWF